ALTGLEQLVRVPRLAVCSLARGELLRNLLGVRDRRVALSRDAVAVADEVARTALVEQVERAAAQHREDEVGDERIDIEPARSLALRRDQGRDRLGQLRDLGLGLAVLVGLLVEAAPQALQEGPPLGV